LKSALATAGAACAFPAVVPASALGRDGAVAPSNRLVMGLIGCGGRGFSDLGWLLHEDDVQFVAVCDVQRAKRDRAKASVDQKYGNADCATFRDFRELLDARKDIDALVIATGDRWHALAAMHCMRAGKDVYCEKPGALTIAEGQALAKVEKETGRIYQTGAQRASETNFVFIGELLRLGRLGKVHTVRAHLGYLPVWPRVNAALPAEPLPPQDELDWDLWLGQCPMRPYNSAYLKPWPVPGWYTQYDFAGGIPQWGSHTILQCQLDLGLADTSAVEYEYPADLARDGMTVRFANGVRLVAQLGGWRGSCGVRYEGDEGWAACADGYERPELSSPKLMEGFAEVVKAYSERTGRPRNHVRDFLQCVKTRQAPRTPASVAHRTMTTNLAMDLCLDLKRSLKWDPAQEAFVGDDEANARRSRARRAPRQA
jgi:hypothetical protein